MTWWVVVCADTLQIGSCLPAASFNKRGFVVLCLLVGRLAVVLLPDVARAKRMVGTSSATTRWQMRRKLDTATYNSGHTRMRQQGGR